MTTASISEVVVVLARESDGEARPGCPFYLSLRTAAILLGVTTVSLELALREEAAPSLLALECAARGNAWTPPKRSERAWTHLREAAWERGAHAASLARYKALCAALLAPASLEPAQASLLAPTPPVERWREVAAGAFWAFGTETTGLSREDRVIELALVEFAGGAPTGLASWLKGRVLVAHSAAFDRRMLEAELRRAGVAVPKVEWICTKEVAKRIHPATSNSLAPMCAQLGVPLPNHHRADCDAEAYGRLLVALASQPLEARHDDAA